MKKIFSGITAMVFMLLFTTVAFADSVYEAEDANLIGASKTEESEAASGGKFVLGFDDPANDAIEFTVNVEEAGSYDVDVAYATLTDGATGIFTVNGSEIEVDFPSTGGWGEDGFEVVSTSFDLEAGENTINVVRGNEYIQLDYIKVLDGNNAGGSADESAENGDDAQANEEVENPKTGDTGMIPFIALGSVALVGGGLLVVSRKRSLNE